MAINQSQCEVSYYLREIKYEHKCKLCCNQPRSPLHRDTCACTYLSSRPIDSTVSIPWHDTGPNAHSSPHSNTARLPPHEPPGSDIQSFKISRWAQKCNKWLAAGLYRSPHYWRGRWGRALVNFGSPPLELSPYNGISRPSFWLLNPLERGPNTS